MSNRGKYESTSRGMGFPAHYTQLNRVIDKLDKIPAGRAGGKVVGRKEAFPASKMATAPLLRPRLLPRSGATDLARQSNSPAKGPRSSESLRSSSSSITSSDTTLTHNSQHEDETRDLKWKIMKLTAENMELKFTTQQVEKAGAELLAEYQKVLKTTKELRQSLSQAQDAEQELHQEIIQLKTELARKPPPLPVVPEKAKHARRHQSPRTVEPSSLPVAQKVSNREREEKQRLRTEVSSMLEAFGKPQDRLRAQATTQGVGKKTLPQEFSTVYTTPSSINSMTTQPSASLSKYTSETGSPQPSTSRFIPKSKPTFEFQFKNITQSLKRSKNFTNFLPETNSFQIKKTGSDSTNESSQQGIQPFEYYYSPKAFMNAILGLRNSSSAVLDPEVKETTAKRQAEDNQNLNESKTEDDGNRAD